MRRFVELAVCAATCWVATGACGGLTERDRPGAGGNGNGVGGSSGADAGADAGNEDASHGSSDASHEGSTDAGGDADDASAGTDADADADASKVWLCLGGSASVSGTYPGGEFSSSSAVFYRQQGKCIDKIVLLFLPVEGVEKAPVNLTPKPYLVVSMQNLPGTNLEAWGELSYGPASFVGSAKGELLSVSPNVVGSFSMLENGFNLNGTFDAPHCKALDQAIECP